MLLLFLFSFVVGMKSPRKSLKIMFVQRKQFRRANYLASTLQQMDTDISIYCVYKFCFDCKI